MNHKTRLLLGGAIFYGAAYACASFAGNLEVNASNFTLSVAPVSALISCLLFYCLVLAERTYATSVSTLSRWIQTWIASLFSATALTFSLSINVIFIAMALFVVARQALPDKLVDEEVSLRRPQVLREFGLKPESQLPLWALVVTFMGVAVVLWALHRI
jgi:nucleoside recognition membrane protein YjiH